MERIKKHLLVYFSTLLLSLASWGAQSEQLPNKAIATDRAVKRKLIVFSGSDWCKNCIRFKEEVLSSEVFNNFARGYIEVVTADFPQRTKLPKETIERNEALAEQYNPDGEFPRLVLLSRNGEEGQVIPFRPDIDAGQFVEQLKDLMEAD